MSKSNITVQTIAKEAGVSVTTVSRVLNGIAEKYRISTRTVQLVEKAAVRLNYSPNKIAKSLRLNRTFTIGLIVPDISNPWFAKIAQGIEKELRARKYNVTLCNSNDDLEIEQQSVALLQDLKVDGMVVAPIGKEHAHFVKCMEDGVPVVLVDRHFPGLPIPFVSADDFASAFNAVEFLIQNGHKNIVCFQGLEGTSSNSQRVAGYKSALEKYKIPLDAGLIVGEDFSLESGYRHAKASSGKWKKGRISAIFSLGSQITLGILKACKEEGVQIPSDFSLVSFDEQDYSELLYTPITTISHFDRQIGKKVIDLLFDQINKVSDSVGSNVIYPTHLIKRASVSKIKY